MNANKLRCAFIALVILSLMTVIKIYNRTTVLEDNLKPPKFGSLDGSLKDIVWLAQVSDLHLSSSDPGRNQDFGLFLKWLQSRVRPSALIISGDLTAGSLQRLDDWIIYKKLVSTYESSSIVLDVRGNHDTYQVVQPRSEEDLFSQFSIQGTNHSRSHLTKIHSPHGSLGILTIDAALMPGLKSPFNYFGWIDSQELKSIQNLVENATREVDNFITIGHYPLSFISSPYFSLKDELRDSKAYLCGHLHDLYGKVPRMYTRHSNGLYELELSDWAQRRKFRLLAIDGGQLSFSDETFSADENFTTSLVTNPTDIRLSKNPEIVEKMVSSTHLRVLVFSTIKSINVSLKIDGKIIENVTRVVQLQEESPLFVAPWNASHYLDGKIHRLSIQVYVEGSAVLHVKTVDFCLSEHCTGERPSYDLAYLLLRPNIVAVIQFTFYMLNFVLILVSLVIQVSPSKFQIVKIVRSFPNLSEHKAIFRTFMWGPLWLVFGPWAVGYLLDETSICFLLSWGVVTHSKIVPADISKAYAILFIIPYFYVIFTIVVFSLISQHLRLRVAFHDVAFTIIMIFQFAHLPYILRTFGFLASLGLWGFLRIVFVYKIWHLTHLAVSSRRNGNREGN